MADEVNSSEIEQPDENEQKQKEPEPAENVKEDENDKKPEEGKGKEPEENKTIGHGIDPKDLTVEGFLFLSMEDADKARLDARKIKILGQKVRSTKVSDLQEVYEKAISNKIFATPIGWTYLSLLRDNLIEAGVSEDELTPIEVSTKITNAALPDEYHPKLRITTPVKKKRDIKVTMILLVAMNIVLVFLVGAMFYVALHAETDNIVNYKQNVTNRYADWEQSLQEREKAVREKERELKIEDTTDYYQGE
ncbi:hypothetical protein [Butyrivibrio sp. NC2002]|uniref:hypothetical protein n=1 Tax=Butyrivibrio sp. NC2002 TaxID=1410610 RepID=UPI0005658B69|nr:hypothetical protein [Butyrivibrio sp. NC2002]